MLVPMTLPTTRAGALHPLAAALHCALLLKEQALLTALEQRAREQRDWIDSSAPEHRLSSESALLHGHASVCANLVRQIQTNELMQRHPPPHLKEFHTP